MIQYFLLDWHCTLILLSESTYGKYSAFKPTMQRNGTPQETIQLHISIYFSNKAHVTLYEASLLYETGCLVLLMPLCPPLFPFCSSGEKSWSWFFMGWELWTLSLPSPSIHQTHLSLRLFPVCPTQHLPQHPESAKAACRALGCCQASAWALCFNCFVPSMYT